MIDLANLHPRVKHPRAGTGRRRPLHPGRSLVHPRGAAEHTPLIRAAREVNDGKPRHITDKVAKVAGRFRDPTIAVLGLTYKPNVDDLRESPALHVAQDLAERQIGKLLVVEPHVAALPAGLCDRTTSRRPPCRRHRRADIVVILVAHNRFRSLNRGALDHKIVVDTVGLISAPPAAA